MSGPVVGSDAPRRWCWACGIAGVVVVAGCALSWPRLMDALLAGPPPPPPPPAASEALRQRAAEIGGTVVLTDYTVADGSVCVVDMRSGQDSTTAELVQGDDGYSWTHDGSSFVTSTARGVCLLTVSGEQLGASLESAPQDEPWLCPATGAVAVRLVGTRGVPGRLAIHSSVADLATQRPTVLGHVGPGASSPTLSPEGETIAFVREGSVWRASAEGGQPVRVSLDLQTDCRAPAWSPDGRWLAYASRSHRDGASLWIAPADGGPPREPCPDRRFGQWAAPCWSPDSSLLLVNDGVLWLLDPATGECGALLARPPTPSMRLCTNAKCQLEWGGLGDRPAWTADR